jgi:hypothetical protein
MSILDQRAGNGGRVLIAATCICLSACTGSLEKLASTDSEGKEQQPKGQAGACTKLSELKIGMTASEVVSACGQKPTRTADIISGGKKIEIWIYANSKLHLTEDKLVRIFDLE